MTIRLENLSVLFENKIILKNLSYSFSSGLTFLVGCNGSGKTTLLHSIAQLVPYQGNILLGEQMLGNFSHKKIAQHLALIRQQNYPRFQLKVLDFVMLGRFPYLNWMGAYRPNDHLFAQDALDTLNIKHLASKAITKLSGGEWQKVLIARALTQQTSIILMDEPAQSLDPKSKRNFYDLLSNMSKEGKTIICSTHDIEVLPLKEGNLLALKNGEIIHQSEKETFDIQFLLEKVY